jgi:tape measure domain-containing protein
MAEQDHKLRFNFIANTRNFDIAIKKSSTRLDSFSKTAGKVGKQITMQFTAPLVAAGGIAVRQAAKFERLQTTLNTLTGSAEAGAEAFEKLVKFSAKTPFQLDELVKVNNTLMGFGLSTNDAFNSLSMLGDIAGIVGGDLQSIGVAFGQAAAEGRVMTRDLRQFINNGVPILDILSKSMGVARGEIMDMASEGKITFDILNNAFINATSEGGKFAGGMETLSKTINGLFSTLKDNVNIALAELGQEIVEILDLKNGIPKLTREIRQSTEAFKNLSPEVKGATFNLIELIGKGGLIAIGIGLMRRFTLALRAVGATLVGIFGSGGALVVGIIGGIALAMDSFNVSINDVLTQIGKAQTVPAEVFKLKTVEARKQLTDLQDEITRTVNKLTIPPQAFTDPLGFLGMKPNALPIIPSKPGGNNGGGGGATGSKIDFTKMLDFDKFFTRDLPDSLKVGFVDTVKGFKTELDFSTVFGDVGFSMKDLTTNAVVPLKNQVKELSQASLSFATHIGQTLMSAFANLGQGENAFQKLGEQLKALIVRLAVAASLALLISAALGNPAAFGKIFGALSGIGGLAGGAVGGSSVVGSATPMANGGIVSTPTNALIGEYPGARSNPEVVAPLNKLKNMLGTSGAMQGEFVLRGQDLVVALQRAERNRNRFK